ncbi:hypothetical protein NUM3379_33740 [Kineococcus sp. NUM-3379]
MDHAVGTVAGPRPPAPGGGPAAGLAGRVRAARAAAFVGRRAEQALFEAVLRGGPQAPSVLYVHGPAGIGKSSLLQALAERARQAGRPVAEVDGRALGSSREPLVAAVAAVRARPGTVLVVDALEGAPGAGALLREVLLPHLPDDAVAVLAGRAAPEVEWLVDPGWSRVLRVVEPAELSGAERDALLDVHGVAPRLRPALVRFAGGNPLVLSMAAAAARADAGPGVDPAASWVPPAALVRAVLAQVVGDLPSPAHRRALETAALLRTTTEDLLREVCGPGEAAALFAWLRELPSVTATGRGLRPRAFLRSALARDLAWRAPEAHHELRTRLTEALARRVREAPAAQALHHAGDLLFLQRGTEGGGDDDAGDDGGGDDGGDLEEALREDERAALRSLVADVTGDADAAAAQHWVERCPGAFRVHRRGADGRPVAVSCLLHLPAGGRVPAADRAAAAAVAHAGPGDDVALSRAWAHPRDAAARRAAHAAALARVCRAPGPARGFVLLPEEDADPGAVRRTGNRVDLGGSPHVLLPRDRLAGPTPEQPAPAEPDTAGSDTTGSTEPDTAVGDAAAGATAVAAPPGPLSAGEFDEAVRAALRAWHEPRALAGSPLLRTGLAAGGTGAQAVESLRAAIRDAVAALRTDVAGVRAHDAVEATYLAGTPTQESAARRLGIPFSTYRRHLRNGLEGICADLRRRA